MADDARSDSSACTATWAPIMPIDSWGFSAFSASATFTSWGNDGVLVCRTASSYSLASGLTSSSVSPSGGASINRDPGTRAAGWASQVGYQ